MSAARPDSQIHGAEAMNQQALVQLPTPKALRGTHPDRSGMAPVTLGFCASTRDCRVPLQAPVPQAAGTLPETPALVKSTLTAADRPARSVRLLRLQLPWNTLGPSCDISLQQMRGDVEAHSPDRVARLPAD